MAVLSASNRSGIWSKWMRLLSQRRDPVSISKTDLRAAVDSVDDWVDTNAASFNSALPVAARTNLTASQKAEILSYVVLRRYEVA